MPLRAGRMEGLHGISSVHHACGRRRGRPLLLLRKWHTRNTLMGVTYVLEPQVGVSGMQGFLYGLKTLRGEGVSTTEVYVGVQNSLDQAFDTMEGRRVRRPVTEEELLDAQIAEELADLPDDEGMQEEQDEPLPVQQELGRRRPLIEPSPELEQEEGSEEEEEEGEAEWQAATIAEGPRPRSDLRGRGVDSDDAAPALATSTAPGRLAPPSAPPPLSAARLAPPSAPPPAAAPTNTSSALYGTLPGPASKHAASNLYSTLPQPAAAASAQEEDSAPAAKRARLSSTPPPEANPEQSTGPPPQQQPAGDQVAAALMRLTSHISNPAKFAKASPLLRQLLDSGTLGKQHRVLVFDAVRAIFSLQPGRQKHLVDPANRREVMKLMAAVEGLAAGSYFKAAEKAQINSVYHLLGVTCNEMQTDDSFIFSKVLAKIREAVDGLPEREAGLSDPEEVAAYAHVTQDKPGSCTHASVFVTGDEGAPAGSHGLSDASAGNATQGQQQQLEAGSRASKAEAKVEAKAEPVADDPFGLDALMQPAGASGKSEVAAEDDPFGLNGLIQEKPAAPARPKVVKPPETPSTAWSPTETGIELLAEHCWKNKLRFSAAQADELDELWAWVRKARAQRKMGPSVKELNRDATSFDRARAEWSRATVSVRGKVGAQGDAKSTSWLG